MIGGIYFFYGDKLSYNEEPKNGTEANSIAYSASPSSQPIVQNIKTSVEAEGKIHTEGNMFVLMGDAHFSHGLTVKNSQNAKLNAILRLVESHTAVKLGGIVWTKYPNEMIVLSVDGKDVLTEQNAMDTQPRQEVGSTQTFADFYATLTEEQKQCVTLAVGAVAVKKWTTQSQVQPSYNDLQKINTCVQ